MQRPDPTPRLSRVLLALGVVTLLGAPLAAQGLQPPTLLEGMEPDPDDIDMRKTPVVRAVERAADSVASVYIVSDGVRFARGQLEGQGSGVIVDESGLVITNWHVIAPVALDSLSHKIKVKLKDGRSVDATLLSSSPVHDLALLQLDLSGGERVKPMVAGDSDSLMVGETVIAIGNPQGHANSVTVGVLSQIDRSITVRTPDGVARSYSGLLQTDAAINQGNSGGALLDITGKLVGINNAMAVGVENIGFAIPVNTVKQVFQDVLLSADNLASVWLGFKLEDRDGRATICSITPDSPADRAGLQVGDRVVEVASRPVSTLLDYARGIVGARGGEPLPLCVERRGRNLQLAPTPLSSAQFEVVRRVGLEFDEVARDAEPELVRAATLEFYRDSRRTRVPALPGVLRVRFVHPGSTAQALGLAAGDVLVGLQVSTGFGTRNLAVTTVAEFADRVRSMAGGSIPITILRGKEGLYGDLAVRRL